MDKTSRMEMLFYAAEMMTNRDTTEVTDQYEMVGNQLMACLITDDWSQLNSKSCHYINSMKEAIA